MKIMIVTSETLAVYEGVGAMTVPACDRDGFSRARSQLQLVFTIH